MENNKNKITYLSILLMMLLLAVGLGSYAYINHGGIRVSNYLDSLTVTGSAPTFTAYSEGEINMSIDKIQMDKNNTNDIAVDTGNSTIHIILDGGMGNNSAICNYDLIWVWDGADTYTESSVELPYTDENGKIYPYEFSIRIDNNESNLSDFTWENNQAIIAIRTIMASSGEIQKDDYEVEVKIYNIPVSQNKLANRNLQGHIEVSEARCSLQGNSATLAYDETLVDSIKTLYSTDGENYLYYHDGQGQYTNSSLEAKDGSYRYAGSNPDNYVCFGDDCSNYDNLYRIIGVFNNKVKLIKADYINSNLLGTIGDYSPSSLDIVSELTLYNYYDRGQKNTVDTYYWNNMQKQFSEAKNAGKINLWNESALNQLNLNTTYLANIDSNYAKMIENSNWVISGGLPNKLSGVNAQNCYNYELATSCDTCDIDKARIERYNSSKVGLMYVSDYYYASSPDYWNSPGYGEEGYQLAINDNWLFLGINEWTISPVSNDNDKVYYIHSSGYVDSKASDYNLAVRPVFYLKENVIYAGGAGTVNDPIKLINN